MSHNKENWLKHINFWKEININFALVPKGTSIHNTVKVHAWFHIHKSRSVGERGGRGGRGEEELITIVYATMKAYFLW